MRVWPFATAPEPLKGCPCIHWFRWKTFWAFFVKCDLINRKNSSPIKLETCTVNVLCQLWVKYSIIQEFIVERNLSIKLKDHSLPDCIYVKCFLCCKELTLEVCPFCIHPMYCYSFSSFFKCRNFVDVKRSLYLMLGNVLGVDWQDAQIPGARLLGRINFVGRRQFLYVLSMNLASCHTAWGKVYIM